MSTVQGFLNGFSDEDLKVSLLEIKRREYDGFLSNPLSKFSELQRLMQITTGMSASEARRNAEFELCLLAAFKWAGITK
jgi:hypothetical protein